MKIREQMVIEVIKIARTAGKIILEEYKKETDAIDWKADNSPLTQADQRSHCYISGELSKIYPEIPVLSEEGLEIAWEVRKKWNQFWCIDPMDGTKEFIRKTGQFTVNIALIEAGRPVLGVIYVPVMNLLYYTDADKAFMQCGIAEPVSIAARKPDLTNPEIVASKDHAGPKVKALTAVIPGAQLKSMGSSLKFCLVAEGKADCYLRDVPTYEWDTAAAQAIVERAGGVVVTLDGQPLQYNKENLLNPSILTTGKETDYWLTLINA